MLQAASILNLENVFNFKKSKEVTETSMMSFAFNNCHVELP